MIKAIVLDIDGVVIGNIEGLNFPQPSKKVKAAIKKIHDNGIPVSFLTGKPSLTAFKNIKSVGVDNPHIADGGATIFNPVRKEIIHQSQISKNKIKQIIDVLPNDTYMNFFSSNKYYLKKSQKNNFTSIYSKFAGQDPELFEDFNEISNEKFTKINLYVFDDKELKTIEKNLDKITGISQSPWSTNPLINPIKVKVITVKGISKQSGVKYLANYLKIPLKNILGVGDTMHDWDFIQICGYRAAMGNASDELKSKIDLNDENQVIGGHVNEDGIIDVFKKFNLI